MSNHQQQVFDGVVGTTTSIFLSIPAWLLDVEFAMKMLCLILSGIASVFTIVKMLKKKR
jgi:hypothetical protein